MAEQIIWRGRPSHITNLKYYTLGVLFCWLIVPIGVAFWKWLEVRGEQYVLTTERLKENTGVLNIRADELELYRVKDTALIQPLFLRLFGLASVELRSTDLTSPLALIEAIPINDAKSLQNTIRARAIAERQRLGIKEFI